MGLARGSFAGVFENCEPYLVARAGVLDCFDLSPLGVAIPKANQFDPQCVSSGPFLNLAKKLDAMTYGPLGLTMPDWVFYDCAVVPGAIFGFARRASELEGWLRTGLGVDASYEGLVPVSLFMALPTPIAGQWIGYTLCSINEVAAGGAPEGLWRLTLAMGTATFQIARMRSTTRWRSPGLGIYASMGPLELVTAFTPAHDVPQTLTFDLRTDRAAQDRLVGPGDEDCARIHRYLDADDDRAMESLQHQLEAGERWAIVGPAVIWGARTRIPLARLDRPNASPALHDPRFRTRFQG